ncbi:MAG TPA: hypothetical protein ENG27_01850 [Candidatus Bathyarchaeota archaeon]|nr:hypothetical protein [Candidatus Bathyarchaeota archaeon]
MGRLYRASSCLKYRESLLSPAPVLRLKFYNVLGEEFPEEFEAPLDTGFEGSIMVTARDYEFFAVGELPRDYWRRYKTITGTIIMRVARAVVVASNKRIETYIEAPVFGIGKRLIGREFLKELVVILDGPDSSCCVGKIEAENAASLEP